MDKAKLQAYLNQATERAAELQAQLFEAKSGAPDWSAVDGTMRSLAANLVSAQAALELLGEG